MDAELKSIFDKLVEESCRPEEAGGNTEHELYDRLLREAISITSSTDTETGGGKTDSEREVEAALLDDLLPAYYNDLLTAQNKEFILKI